MPTMLARLDLAYPRHKAEAIVTGLERPLNRHLLKLMGFDVPERTRKVWRYEIETWLTEIAAIRLRKGNRRLPARDLYDWLYDEPFGGVEVENTEALLRLMARRDKLARNRRSAAEIAADLRALHERLAERLAAGETGMDLIEAL